MKNIFISILFCWPLFVFTQQIIPTDTLTTPTNLDNIYSRKIAEDSLQSSFVIWIKGRVTEHYHQAHSENIYVLEGKAEMTINGEKRIIRKGDYITIPMNTRHAVTKVLSRKPLKVLSIQSPRFDGTDRIFVKPPHADF